MNRTKIEKEFSYPVETVGGVAFDGSAVWFSDPQNQAIVRVDRESGKVRRRLRGPKIGSGTTWDGERLWQIGDGRIQCIDPKTGKVVRSFPVPTDGFASGLAWDGEAIWCGAYEERRLYKLDPRTGKVLRTVQSDRFVTGITWVGDELWHATYPEGKKGTELRRVDARSGEVVERVEVPCTISGMAWDGEAFWCGDCDHAQLRAIKVKARTRKPARRRAAART